VQPLFERSAARQDSDTLLVFETRADAGVGSATECLGRANLLNGMANPESIDDNLWGRVDAERWRDTPCVARRVALEDDAKSGHAVFFVENPSELDSSAMNLDLPCCALLNEEGEISPVLIVQAERHGAQTLIGYRPLSGGNGICTLEEVVLLNGPDSHFGLGFYSSFMVSDKVVIQTKTYQTEGDTKPVLWECDGSPEYTMEDSKKKDRGTEVILYIADDSKDYLEEYKVLEILKKYCKFLPVPIRFGSEKTWEKVTGEKDEKGNDKEIEIEKPRIINNTDPLWGKKPTDLKDEDYKQFYRELYPYTFE